MNFLHSDFHGGPDDVAVVSLDGQANVMLLDDCNFQAYRRGGSYRYIGGLATQSPVRLSPSHVGHWHIVVDLGGYAGHVRAGVHILRRSGALC
jgi:hypothetical protein